MNWIIENKEWFFSGIGATILTIIVSLFFQSSSKKKRLKQIQKSGSHSNNIQVGGDYKA